MNGKLIFGLDLGLNNVGYAAVRVVSDDEVEVLHIGTYVFSSPLVKDHELKSGYSAGQRGQIRRARRTIRRRAARKRALYRELAALGFLPRTKSERDKVLCKNKVDGKPFNPYLLRERALNEAVTPFALGRILTHLCNHRGFLSPKAQRLVGVAEDLLRDEADGNEADDKKKKDDSENGVNLKQIAKTRKTLQELGCPTVGAYYAARIRNNEPIRLKTKPNRKRGGRKLSNDQRPAFKPAQLEERFVRADRFMLRDEFDAIIEAQKPHHPFLTESTVAKLQELIFHQRPIDRKYDTRGHCGYYPSEKRIYRASMPAQRFVIAQDLANLKILASESNLFTDSGMTGSRRSVERVLTRDERETLMNVLLSGEDLPWKAARTLLNLEAKERFNREPHGNQKSGKTDGLRGSKTVNEVAKVLGNDFRNWSYEHKAELVNALIEPIKPGRDNLIGCRFQTLKSAEFGPERKPFDDKTAARLATLQLPDGTLNLSLKAIKRLLPLMMKQALHYNEAVEKMGFDHRSRADDVSQLEKLNPQLAEGILHPGVRCSVQNAYRVINALMEKYGRPNAIHVELPRDLAKPLALRLKEELEMRVREKKRIEIRRRLYEARIRPTRENVRKVQLFDECSGQLVYEPGQFIHDLKDLCSDRYEVDHIVPRSLQIVDGLGNLVLCSSDVNRHKGNRTPYEYFGEDGDRWARIVAGLETLKNMDPRKKARIMSQTRPEGFVDRHLTATGYIGKEIHKALNRLNPFLPKGFEGQGQPEGWIDIVVTEGKITGLLRRQWSLDRLIPLHPEEEAKRAEYEKMEEEGTAEKDPPKLRSNYKHHALDALVVALTTRSLIRRVAAYYAQKEEHREAKFPLPDPAFVAKVTEALEVCPVVHKPNRKIEGQINKPTAHTPNPSIPDAAPYSAKVVGNQLIRYDHNGKPYAAYKLHENHHVAIFRHENMSGKVSYAAEVRSLYEVYQRRRAKLPPINLVYSHDLKFEFVMALCKGDMVEMADGTIGVVSKFANTKKAGTVDTVIWHAYVAQQIGGHGNENPYLLARISSAGRLTEIQRKIDLTPLGDVRM